MTVGNMEAFCVGEPWNEQLVNQGIGFTGATTGESWARHPEKVLGMRADWVDANPKTAIAIIAAVIEAQMWCEDPTNKDEMAAIVSTRQWYNVPVADIIGRLKGDISYGNGRVETKPGLAMKFRGKKAKARIHGNRSTAGSLPNTSAGARCRVIWMPQPLWRRPTVLSCGCKRSRRLASIPPGSGIAVGSRRSSTENPLILPTRKPISTACRSRPRRRGVRMSVTALKPPNRSRNYRQRPKSCRCPKPRANRRWPPASSGWVARMSCRRWWC